MERGSFEKRAVPKHNQASVIPQDLTTVMTLFVLWSSRKTLPSTLSDYLQLFLFLEEWKASAEMVNILDSGIAGISVTSKRPSLVRFIHCILTLCHWFNLSQRVISGSALNTHCFWIIVKVRLQVNGWTSILKWQRTMKEDQCNDKIYQEMIHGLILLLTKKMVHFHGARNYREPQLEFNNLPYLKDVLQVPEVSRTLWSEGTLLLKVNKLVVGLLHCPWICGISVHSWKYIAITVKITLNAKRWGMCLKW